MKLQQFFLYLFVFVFLFVSCSSVQIAILRSERVGNTVYIENSDDEGNIIGIDNLIINNITFFPIDFIIYGIKNIDDTSSEIYKSKVNFRSQELLTLSEDIKNTINQYKYFCIQFSQGTLKKCSAYIEDRNLIIDIEQFGIEPCDDKNEIDPKVFIDLEKKFNQIL